MSRVWVPGCAIAILLILCLVIISNYTRRAQTDQIVYTLDDPYIHMAMAKNVVESGVYGVTRHEFSSSSSSTLWTLALAGLFWLLGPRDILPLVVNILAGVALICVVYGIVRRHDRGPIGAMVLLLLVLFLTPVVPVIFTGMEHILQIVLTLLFLWCCGEAIQREGKGVGLSPRCVVMAVLVTAIRYEGVFVVVAVAAVFLMQKKYFAALILLAAGALAPTVYGLVAWAHGDMFLPNSVFLKGNRPQFHTFNDLYVYLCHGMEVLEACPHMFVLVIGCCVLALLQSRRGKLSPRQQLFLGSFLLTTMLHLQFAGIGWFYRYEAYLVTMAFVTAGVVAGEELQHAWQWFRSTGLTRKIVVAFLLFAMSWPLYARAKESWTITPMAMTNVYRQQCQMARFLQQHTAYHAVAANDIGAICWKADLKLLDLVGLGTSEVIRDKLDGKFNTQDIRELAARRGIQIAIVYYSWYKGAAQLPPEWTLVGAWRIRHNVICGDDTVVFCAVPPQSAEALQDDLAAFSKTLPEKVQVYRRGPSPAGLAPVASAALGSDLRHTACRCARHGPGCIRFSVAQKELRMWRTLAIARFSALFGVHADCNSAQKRATGKSFDLRSLFRLPLIAERTPRARVRHFLIADGSRPIRMAACGSFCAVRRDG